MTNEKRWRIILGSVALLITTYYVIAEMIINLYSEVIIFHIAWTFALAALWHRAFRPSFSFLPNLMTVGVLAIALYGAYAQLEHAYQRTYAESQQVHFERLGVQRGDLETDRDPLREVCWKAQVYKDYKAAGLLRDLMVNRKPGWCRATVVLARTAGEEVPRVINWTPADQLTLCGTPAVRAGGLLPFPTLAYAKATLRIERELLAAADALRQRSIAKAP